MKKNNNKPLVSVIMAEYSTRTANLKEAISSILSQTFTNFELLIVDDCGINDLSEIVHSFRDMRIKIIKNPANMGLVASLNTAIEASSTNYLVRMDTDDIAEPNRIETIYRYIIDHPEYSVVGSRVVEFTGTERIGVLGETGEKTAKEIAFGNTLVHPSVIMNKKDVQEVGCYKNYKRAEDLALWCELLLHKKRLFVINDILLKYRVNPEDYSKRTLRNRTGELKARITYYPKMKAPFLSYLVILKSILAGVMPTGIVRMYRKRFVTRSM